MAPTPVLYRPPTPVHFNPNAEERSFVDQLIDRLRPSFPDEQASYYWPIVAVEKDATTAASNSKPKPDTTAAVVMGGAAALVIAKFLEPQDLYHWMQTCKGVATPLQTPAGLRLRLQSILSYFRILQCYIDRIQAAAVAANIKNNNIFWWHRFANLFASLAATMAHNYHRAGAQVVHPLHRTLYAEAILDRITNGYLTTGDDDEDGRRRGHRFRSCSAVHGYVRNTEEEEEDNDPTTSQRQNPWVYSTEPVSSLDDDGEEDSPPLRHSGAWFYRSWGVSLGAPACHIRPEEPSDRHPPAFPSSASLWFLSGYDGNDVSIAMDRNVDDSTSTAPMVDVKTFYLAHQYSGYRRPKTGMTWYFLTSAGSCTEHDRTEHPYDALLPRTKLFRLAWLYVHQLEPFFLDRNSSSSAVHLVDWEEALRSIESPLDEDEDPLAAYGYVYGQDEEGRFGNVPTDRFARKTILDMVSSLPPFCIADANSILLDDNTTTTEPAPKKQKVSENS